MATYFAFDLGVSESTSVIFVDTDPAKLWERLRQELNDARNSGGWIDSLIVGTVEAPSPVLAVDEVRADNFVTSGHLGGLVPA